MESDTSPERCYEPGDARVQVIYLSSLYSSSQFRDMCSSMKQVPPQAAQKFHGLLVRGLGECRTVDVKVVSAPAATGSSLKHCVVKSDKDREGGVSFVRLPFVDLPLLRNISVFLGTLIQLHRLKGHGDALVVCDVLRLSQCAAARLAQRWFGLRCIAIVTDLPQVRPTVKRTKYGRLLKGVGRLGGRLANHFAGYVVLTEAMMDLVRPSTSPYIVMEGVVDADHNPGVVSEQKSGPMVCMYTGGTNKIYGVMNLVNGFLAANIHDLELHIYGRGDCDDELRDVATAHPSVIFRGQRANVEVVAAQGSADLLVNPRPVREEYVKYSFPSKNMEYLNSGVPAMTTDLPGMPRDHRPHLEIIGDDSPEGISQSLIKFFEQPRGERLARAAGAAEFVREFKGHRVQAERILAFARSLNTPGVGVGI